VPPCAGKSGRHEDGIVDADAQVTAGAISEEAAVKLRSKLSDNLTGSCDIHKSSTCDPTFYLLSSGFLGGSALIISSKA